MRKRIWRECLLALLGVLPLAGWVRFLVLTRNVFRLEMFTGADQALCLGLTAVPVILWLAVSSLRQRRGLDPAGALFSLGCCGWLLVLCSQWDDWSRAVAVEAIGLLQQNRLRLTALVCFVICLIPLVKMGLDSLRKGEKP